MFMNNKKIRLHNKSSDEYKNNKKPKGTNILRNIKFIIIAFIIGFFSSVLILNFFNKSSARNDKVTIDGNIIKGPNYTATVKAVEDTVKSASNLVTTEYFYKDADTYVNYREFMGYKVPLTTDMSVFTYKGKVGIGIDLSEASYSVDNTNGIITVTLPEVKIMYNEIDMGSFQYAFKSDSILNNTDMENHTQLLEQLKNKTSNEVNQDSELLQKAGENARNVISTFLTSAEQTKDYKVEFK